MDLFLYRIGLKKRRMIIIKWGIMEEYYYEYKWLWQEFEETDYKDSRMLDRFIPTFLKSN